ncbi:hypothetical protein HFP51_02620 [Parasphingopyxis sp. CP4]|uniref:hypothetical protein n=1 Tax=Parasphingopyxis sp. CP4 TaxID=2724527 RepID=UPI0015A251EB|nr:hypothetical protein [Parasphingopyxis sp. CP4]QLC21174.1 hypothetical protein HFP51_02620 [Parasphingopyxis sp. CP4]
MKRIATTVAAFTLISACAEAGSEDAYEEADTAAEELQQPSQHFEPAEPPNDAEMAAETDAE